MRNWIGKVLNVEQVMPNTSTTTVDNTANAKTFDTNRATEPPLPRTDIDRDTRTKTEAFTAPDMSERITPYAAYSESDNADTTRRASGGRDARDENAQPVQPSTGRRGDFFPIDPLVGIGTFLSKDGTRFFAGTTILEKQFPRDFSSSMNSSEISTYGRSVPVTVKVDFGWTDLMTFTNINRLLEQKPHELTPTLAISPVQILKIRVMVSSSSGVDVNAVVAAVSDAVRREFNRSIPTDIMVEAQQRLATEYVSHGYPRVVVVTQ